MLVITETVRAIGLYTSEFCRDWKDQAERTVPRAKRKAPWRLSAMPLA